MHFKHFRIYTIPLWFLMSRHQIAGVSSSLVFQRFETFCLLFFINSIWQEFLVWVKTWNSHNQCMMHQNSKYYCQNCSIIYLKSRISSLTAKTKYFYITSTITTQMNSYGYGGRSLRPFLRPKVFFVVSLFFFQNGGWNVFFITQVPP